MTTRNLDSETGYVQEWRAWRAGWEQFLAQPYGWLAVTAINWVDTTPREYPGQPGLWWQEGNILHVDPQGQTMSYDGESFTEARGLDLSATPDDVRITAGDIQIGVTYRDEYLIVAYDPQAQARADFRGVPTYEPDPHWVLKGRFEPHADERSVVIDSVGTDAHTYRTPGVVRFTRAGDEYTLLLVSRAGQGMNAVFADTTGGVTTYGVRALPVPEPDEDGTMVLDFNRTINLPCAFNDMPVCPAAPPENRLPFAVEAGEKLPVRNSH